MVKKIVVLVAIIGITLGTAFGSSYFNVDLSSLSVDELLELSSSANHLKTGITLKELREEILSWQDLGIENVEILDLEDKEGSLTIDRDTASLSDLPEILSYWQYHTGLYEVMCYDLSNFDTFYIGTTRLNIKDSAKEGKLTIFLFRAGDETNSVLRIYKYLS